MKVFASIIAGLAFSSVPVRAELPPVNYIAHEWGTFTSVQGADGEQMSWNPLLASDLPKFVYGREGIFDLSKAAFATRQRMETPVIYFHSDQVFNVDVEVLFPKGRVTEWYPRGVRPTKRKADQPAISWPGVTVIPRESKEASGLAKRLPAEEAESHYFAARAAEADYVSVANGDKSPEIEKFLFYRGVADFIAPLKVTMPVTNGPEVRLENTGDGILQSAIVLRVGEGFMTITPVGNLEPKADRTIAVGDPLPIEEGREKLGAMLRKNLSGAGLTSTEADAMVKTWDESWFTERGVRVLYILPQAWADSILPLKLTPAPNQIARVFVGRAEVITPQVEQFLTKEIDRAKTDDLATRTDVVKNIRSLGLGRFLEPAFRRIASQRPTDRDFSTRGWELLSAATQPTPTFSRR
ncbi:MAG TPA: hypothetical protein VFG14_07110 [Chthoniobacteraceae bacterium]|nr:hypothetical protein [Chthoniobacteraceae bacterium]